MKGKKNNKKNKPKSGSGPSVRALTRNDVPTVIRAVSAPLFPQRTKQLLLSWNTSFSLAVPATTLAGGYVISANDIYDPSYSGGPTRPMGFDQMMLSFEHFTVHKCTLYATFRNDSTTVFPTVAVAVRPSNVLGTDPYAIMEAGNTTYTKLGPISMSSCLKELSMAVNVAKFLGVDDLQDFESGRGGLATSPLEQCYFHIHGWNVDTAASTGVYVNLRVEYHVVFSEPRVLPTSLMSNVISLLKNDLKFTESKS